MDAVIKSLRRGRHTTTPNQIILVAQGINSREKAFSLVGKKVVWATPGGKELRGKISAAHGGNGAMRARFSKGLPGQCLGTKAEIIE